jgi:hypothetical protein
VLTDDAPTAKPAPARPGARVLAEAVGTALLVAAVIGSGPAARGSPRWHRPAAAGERHRHRRRPHRADHGAAAGLRRVQPGRHRARALTNLISTQQAALTVAALLGGAAGAVLADLRFGEPAITVASTERT